MVLRRKSQILITWFWWMKKYLLSWREREKAEVFEKGAKSKDKEVDDAQMKREVQA